MRIAVNFPYFVPYTGYFRLFSSTDLFVIFDCVPFPRRGYVHRNQLPDRDGEARWFTLPLKYATRDTRIKDMQFVDDIEQAIVDNTRRFPVFDTKTAAASPLIDTLMHPHDGLVDYLERTLRATLEILWAGTPARSNIPATSMAPSITSVRRRVRPASSAYHPCCR